MKPRASEPASCCLPAEQKADLRPIEGDEADEELSTLGKALGRPARVEIQATAQISGASNHLRHSLSDGRLRLYEECNERPCRVSVRALVPAKAPIEIHTGSGDVRIQRASDRVRVNAGSGDVSGSDLAGVDLDVQTGSGDIDVRVREPAQRVSLHAGSGDVRLAVPAGAYRLQVDTASGDENLEGVTHDAAAPASIAVDTGSGDVKISGH